MTDSLRFELTDDRIERMLAERAGSGTPAALVPAVMAAAADVAQSPAGWRPLGGSHDTGSRRTWALAAAAALATLALAAAIVGSGIVRPPNPVVVPPATTAPSATPSSSSSPSLEVSPSTTPSAAPSATPSVAIPPAAAGPMIVYKLGPNAVDLFTLDPVTGDRVALGNLPKPNRTGRAVDRLGARSPQRDNLRRQRYRHRAGERRHQIGQGASALGRPAIPTRSPRRRSRRHPGRSRRPPRRLRDGPRRVGGQPQRGAARRDHAAACHQLGAGRLGAVRRLVLPVRGEGRRTSQHLFRVPIDGSPVEDVLEMTGGYFGYMSWSPDGSTLLFAHPECGDTTCVGGIATVRLADKVITDLTTNGGNSPTWSSDGLRIAFARDFGASGPGITSSMPLARTWSGRPPRTRGSRRAIGIRSGPRTGGRSCSRADRSTRAWATCTSCRRPVVRLGCWSRTPWQIGRPNSRMLVEPDRPWACCSRSCSPAARRSRHRARRPRRARPLR